MGRHVDERENVELKSPYRCSCMDANGASGKCRDVVCGVGQRSEFDLESKGGALRDLQQEWPTIAP